MCVQTPDNTFIPSSSGSEGSAASTKPLCVQECQEGQQQLAASGSPPDAQAPQAHLQDQQQQPFAALLQAQHDGGGSGASAARMHAPPGGTAPSSSTSSRPLRLSGAPPDASDEDMRQQRVMLETSDQAAAAASEALQSQQPLPSAAPMRASLAQQQGAATPAEQPADEQPAVERPADMPAGRADGSGHVTLFFAKVPRSAPEADVRQLFASFGAIVELNLFTEYEGALASKGCGLVVMESSDAALAVINALDSKHKWPGMRSPMVVKLMTGAVQKKCQDEGSPYNSGLGMHAGRASSSSGSGGGAYAHAGGRPGPFPTEQPPPGCEPDAYKLFIGNVPKRCTEHDLRPVFEAVGHVVELVVLRDRLSQESKGSAFVWYASRAEADMAIARYHMTLVMSGHRSGSIGAGRVPLVVRRAAVRGRGGAAASTGAAYSYGSGGSGSTFDAAAAAGGRAAMLPPGLGGAAAGYRAAGVAAVAGWPLGLHGGAATPAAMQPHYQSDMLHPYQQQQHYQYQPQQATYMQRAGAPLSMQLMAQQYLQQPMPAPYMQPQQVLQGMQGLQLHEVVSSMPMVQPPVQAVLHPSQVLGQPGSGYAVAASADAAPQMMQPHMQAVGAQLQAGGAPAAGMLPASPLVAPTAGWGHPSGLAASSSIQQHAGSAEAAQTIQLQVTGQQAAAVSGRLQSIAAMTGVSVRVVQQGGSTVDLSLSGGAQQVAAACQLLQGMLAEAAQQGALQGSSSLS